jgi:hypothetical protein
MSNYYVEVGYYSSNPMNPNQREHWSIFVSTDGVNGTIYEATGGTLQMIFNQKADVKLTKSSTYKGKVRLGVITEGQRQTLERVLSGVPLPSSPLKIPPGYRRRDCQDWVRDAAEALIEAGLLDAAANKVLDTIPVP